MQVCIAYETRSRLHLVVLLSCTQRTELCSNVLQLVLAGQRVVETIAGLKKDAIINDFTKLNHNVKDVGAALDRKAMANDSALAEMRCEVRCYCTLCTLLLCFSLLTDRC